MLSAVLWAGLAGWGQGEEWTPKLRELLTQLVQYGERYEQALPTLSCEEEITSQRVRGGRVEEVKLTGTVQVRRSGNEADPFVETHVTRTRDGVPLAEGKSFRAPYYVLGGFANGLSFSSMERLHCYAISLKDEAGSATLELEMERKAGVEGVGACAKIPEGARRRVVVDRESGHVVRIERVIPAEEAHRLKQVDVAAIDYEPVELGAERFWLPVRSEMRDTKGEGRMRARYRGCKRYTGTVTIVNGVEKVPQE